MVPVPQKRSRTVSVGRTSDICWTSLYKTSACLVLVWKKDLLSFSLQVPMQSPCKTRSGRGGEDEIKLVLYFRVGQSSLATWGLF